MSAKTEHPCPLPPDNGDITPYTPPENRSNEQTQVDLIGKTDNGKTSRSGKRKTKATTDTKTESKLINSWFDAWFAIYPSEGGERGAKRSFPKAIRRIAKNRGLTIEAAHAWLMEATREFAISERGAGRYCPYANKFLAESEFDKPSLWNPSQNGNGSAPSEYKILKIHRRAN